jgi:hypothetical protein
MYQPVLVNDLHAQRRASNRLTRFVDRQRAQSVDNLAQISTVDELHDKKVRLAISAGIARLHDTRVAQSADNLDFAPEPGERMGFAKAPRGQRLQRNQTLQQHVARPVHRPHTTFAKSAEQLILAHAPRENLWRGLFRDSGTRRFQRGEASNGLLASWLIAKRVVHSALAQSGRQAVALGGEGRERGLAHWTRFDMTGDFLETRPIETTQVEGLKLGN